MSEELQRNDFIGYKYRNITVKKTIQSVYADSFGSFGWIIPYPIFKGVSSKKTEMLNPLIAQKYDELYTVCEKAKTIKEKRNDYNITYKILGSVGEIYLWNQKK